MVVLTEDERRAMEGAGWACFTPEGDRRVGETLVRLLTEGIIIPDDPDAVAEFVAEQSGVEEVTDTEAVEVLVRRLRAIQAGKFPRMRQAEA